MTSSTQKTLTIELRYTPNSPDDDDIILERVREAARLLILTTALISGRQKPDIAIYNDDMFEGREKIEMSSPQEQ